MKTYKRVLKTIAKNHKIDPVELLVTLWDYSTGEKFDYLLNENSVIKGKDISLVREIIYSKTKHIQQIKEEKTIPEKLIIRDFNFSSIGSNVVEVAHLTKDEILTIHNELTDDFALLDDPIDPPGVKDEKLLESALFHPQTSMGGINKYPTPESAAAALMYAISSNHAFHNGNKRTAMVAMLVLLDKHHLAFVCDQDQLFKTSVRLADHKLVPEPYRYADAEIFELAKWISSKSHTIEKGERIIKLRSLRRILSSFNCIIENDGHVTRKLPTLGIFGTDKVLRSKRRIDNTISEGNEVDKGLVKSIREDLQLDHEHGIDSKAFYEDADFTSSEFIVKYQSVLRKLSYV